MFCGSSFLFVLFIQTRFFHIGRKKWFFTLGLKNDNISKAAFLFLKNVSVGQCASCRFVT